MKIQFNPPLCNCQSWLHKEKYTLQQYLMVEKPFFVENRLTFENLDLTMSLQNKLI